ncbi:aTPase/histidine kinase/DNA gyrase B/HSP90 domain protein [Clostridium sp. CAG:269]|nr:aTPase/histidine kinase/DNA gyrase B/HSP90 domain protein [Clostridium sp. CAG:269]
MEEIRSILRLFMEWGIRLKNNDMKKIVKSTFWSFIVQCMISLTIMGIIMIILAESRAIFDFQWLYNIFPHLYDLLDNIYELVFERAYFIFIIFGTTLIIVLSLLYKLLNKIFSYVFAVSESADKLFDKNVEYINLPPEMVEVEKKLNHFKTEAIKNERLARENEQKKDELIVYLAHDIKTPLTSMIGYLSLLSEIKDMPQEQRNRYIDIALDKSYRLEYLINELFDVARFNSEKIVLEKEEINLNLMLEQIADDFYPTLKEMNKKINFTSDEKTILYADPDKLSRVFNNLIKNAVNYSKENTDIDISILNKENQATVKITNKGKQIPKEKLDKIFEKFYRLDSSRTSKTGGSGLGLAIAKEIVELHGGRIYAESDMKETTFSVILPIIEQA